MFFNPMTVMIFASAALLGIVGIFSKKMIIKRSAIIWIAVVIAFREQMIGVFHRSKMSAMGQEGTLTKQFADGAILIYGYCRESSPVVYLGLLLVVTICYRSLRKEK